MSIIHVKRSLDIDVSSAIIYECLIDYENHHNRFLPPSFVDYKVEQGGYGDGTVVSFAMKMAGRRQPLRVRIEEEVPGRVFREISLTSALVTVFTVTPRDNGCTVTFDSSWRSGKGLAGLLERWLAPGHVGRLFEDELARLAAYGAARAAAA